MEEITEELKERKMRIGVLLLVAGIILFSSFTPILPGTETLQTERRIWEFQTQHSGNKPRFYILALY